MADGDAAPIAVTSTEYFDRAAARLFTEEERAALEWAIADNPTAGDLVPGGEGLRKVRVALPGRGKRGGARVIYYFHDEMVPLYLLDAYAKSVKGDLSRRELAALVRTVRAIKEAWKARE